MMQHMMIAAALVATSATFAGTIECAAPLHTAKLTADDGDSDDRFGSSVAISGGVAVIGADGDDDNGSDSGSAYVFEQQVDGTWSHIAKLTADDGDSGDEFGISVAISGGVAVVGAWGDEDNGSWSGSAYIFEQQAGGTWLQIAKLTADDGARNVN
ncbi:MAG: FG-GAP repeat protein, partial [Phycisphaerales bacterium]|nr:FG-GAP repeat protein [Phycisphaerales bacterium]